jgi:hypothetical protein
LQILLTILFIWTFFGTFLLLFIDIGRKKPNILGKILIGPGWLILLLGYTIDTVGSYLFEKVVK